MGVDYQYTLKRCLHAVPTLFLVTLAVFMIVHIIPGSPGRAILGTQATPEAIAQVESDMGLDRPIPVQYFDWVTGLLVGDLGYSYQNNMEVSSLLISRFGVTFHLIFWTFILTVLISIPLGIYSALRKGKPFDNGMVVFSTLGISLPEIVTGVALLQILGLGTGIFPVKGYVSPTESIIEYFRHITLPVLSLTVPAVAVVMRMTRSTFWESLQQDFARFYRANGLREGVINRRVLEKSMVPILTILGIHFGYMLAGAVVIEQLFGLPGIGQSLVRSTRARDIPVVQATVLIIAVWFVVVNLITDLLVEHYDPRIRGDR